MEPPLTIQNAAARPLDPAEAAARIREFAVLDVRDPASFASGHVHGSGNIPIGELQARRIELPPREIPILVVAEAAPTAALAAGRLVDFAFATLFWLDAPLATLGGGRASRDPPVRLWRPASFLESVLPQLPRGRTADLACGAGREAVFLAMNGFAVEAWDADPDALARTEALAARHDVRLTTVPGDLEAPDPGLPEAAYDLIVCFRFLHRPLFPAIERALAPGGHLVYETYRVGQERFGRPRRARFLLEPGELARAFPGLETLRFEELDPPEGPLTSRLLAQKPAS